uniref:Uncharacterized protein n=1 Tax=Arundo donax TaxID=35708 RepID=A0A0A9C433_ARUDO
MNKPIVSLQSQSVLFFNKKIKYVYL